MKFIASFVRGATANKLGALLLVLGTSIYFAPIAQASIVGPINVVCATTDGAQQTYQIGWDNTNSFFNGKGYIPRLFCEGGYAYQHPVYVSDELTDSSFGYYNGVVVDPQPTPTPSSQPTPTASPSPSPSQSTSETSTVSPSPSPSVETNTVPSPSPSATVEPTPSSTPSPTPQNPETSTVVDTATVDSSTVNTETSTTSVVPQPVVPTPDPVVPTPIPAPVEPVVEPQPKQEPEPVPVVQDPIPDPLPTPDPIVDTIPEPQPTEPEPVPVEPVPVEPTPTEPTVTPVPVDQPKPPVIIPEPVIVPQPASEPVVVVLTKDTDLKSLAPDTPVQLDNGVVLTAEVVVALQVLESPAELISTMFTNPGEAIKAFANIGADLAPEVRAKAKKVVISAIVAGNIATTATLAASPAATYRRKP